MSVGMPGVYDRIGDCQLPAHLTTTRLVERGGQSMGSRLNSVFAQDHMIRGKLPAFPHFDCNCPS